MYNKIMFRTAVLKMDGSVQRLQLLSAALSLDKKKREDNIRKEVPV